MPMNNHISYALRCSLCALVIVLIGGTESVAQETAPIDSLARAFYADANAPGLVVGTLNGVDQQVRAYGVASYEDSTQVHEDTQFEIGSITKVFVGLLLAQQVESNTVELRDPVDAYLPDSVDVPTANDASIELIHLATHSAGLPRLPDNLAPANRFNPYVDYTEDKLYAYLSEARLASPPGTSYAYSNLGTGLLGTALAQHADTTLAAALHQHILGPLQLDDTVLPAPTDSIPSNLAAGYDMFGAPTPYWYFDALAGAGALRSTPADMLRFLRAQLDPEATPLAEALRATHNVQYQQAGGPTLGIGWHIQTLADGTPFYWHNGGTGGFRSFAGFSLEHNTALLILVNKAVPLQSFNAFAFECARLLARTRDDS